MSEWCVSLSDLLWTKKGINRKSWWPWAALISTEAAQVCWSHWWKSEWTDSTCHLHQTDQTDQPCWSSIESDVNRKVSDSFSFNNFNFCDNLSHNIHFLLFHSLYYAAMQCVTSYDLNELIFEKFILDKNIFHCAFYLVSTRLYIYLFIF